MTQALGVAFVPESFKDFVQRFEKTKSCNMRRCQTGLIMSAQFWKIMPKGLMPGHSMPTKNKNPPGTVKFWADRRVNLSDSLPGCP